MRLTKDVRQQLLEQNDGFTTTSNYSAKNYSEHRRYEIRGGELHILSNSNTSWADSRERSEYVADEEQTHRFLYDNLGLLNQDGVVERAPQRKLKPALDQSNEDAPYRYAEGDEDDEDREIEDKTDFDPNASITPLMAGAALLLAFAGVAVWNNTAKPALDRRRAAREERKAAKGRSQEECTDDPDAVSDG